MSYECKNADTLFNLERNSTVTFKNVYIDVFKATADDPKVLKQCDADMDINDMIPIAVGAALLSLVGVVLIAYFFGRRRSRRLAYQSV